MEELLKRLDELMGGAAWPDRWMTLPQILAELERAGFWAACGREDATDQEKADVVRSALYHHHDAQEDQVWVEIGGQYKHRAKLTAADQRDIDEWDVSFVKFHCRQIIAILEGKDVRPSAPPPPLGPQESIGDALAQAEELIARVRGLADALGWACLVEHFDQALELGASRDRVMGELEAGHLILVDCRVRQLKTMANVAQFFVMGELEAGRLIRGQLPPAVVELKKAARQIWEVLERCPDLQKLMERDEG